MGEKTHLYGLRVAWCVFGDVKDVLAKDIFVSGGGSQVGHAEVIRSDALTPPPPLRSRLTRERAFVWDDVQEPLLVVTPDIIISQENVDAGHFDNLDSDTDSDSEYSDASDEDIESAESDDLDLDLDLSLDDEEQVERDIMALLSREHHGDKTVDGDSRWDMMSFML